VTGEEPPPDTIARSHGRSSVLLDDISHLVTRVEQHALSSISECYELQCEIHELQAILSDWDAYVAIEITRKAVARAIDGLATQVKRASGRHAH